MLENIDLLLAGLYEQIDNVDLIEMEKFPLDGANILMSTLESINILHNKNGISGMQVVYLHGLARLRSPILYATNGLSDTAL